MCTATPRACTAGGIAPLGASGCSLTGGRPPFWLPRLAKLADYIAEPVVRGGIEPPAFRFSGASAPSLDVAGCGLMGDLAAQTVAGCRLMWPNTCRRWLPVWLPLELEDLISLSVEPARVSPSASADERTTLAVAR